MTKNIDPTAMSPTRVCLTVDAEGDVAENPRSTFWGIEYVTARLLGVLSRLRIKATFFVQEDRLCRAGSRFRNLWRSIENDGHEIGYHAHGLIRASADERAAVIASGLQTLRDLGFDPVSFRGGCYHLNGTLLRVLEGHGIRYDSSVVPGLKESFRDGTVRCDHVGAPAWPYRPSYDDHRREGDSKILEIPINRYPHLPSQSGGILKGTERLEEVLFDYFHEVRKDGIILVNIHSWDGLSAVPRYLVRRGRNGLLKTIGLRSLARVLPRGSLVNGAYAGRFENLLTYMIRKGDVSFATIREVGFDLTQAEKSEDS